MKKKIASKRLFLEPLTESDSYITLNVWDGGHVELKLADCHRSINWSFGGPGQKRGIRKIKKIKALIDEVHAYLTEES